MRRFAILLALIMSPFLMLAQQEGGGSDIAVDYGKPQTYVIGGVRVTGNQYLDSGRIMAMIGLQPGKSVTIPGEEIIAKLGAILNQKKFSDAGIYIDSIPGYLPGYIMALRKANRTISRRNSISSVAVNFLSM